MHDQGLMKNLIQQIEAAASREGATRVDSVQIFLGALSHFTPEHFREHFDEAAQGSIAATARLQLEASADIHDANAQHVILKTVEIS